MRARWVALTISGARLGEPFAAEDRRQAAQWGELLHGPACVAVQSLVSWEEAQLERQVEERNRRMFPRLTEMDR